MTNTEVQDFTSPPDELPAAVRFVEMIITIILNIMMMMMMMMLMMMTTTTTMTMMMMTTMTMMMMMMGTMMVALQYECKNNWMIQKQFEQLERPLQRVRVKG